LGRETLRVMLLTGTVEGLPALLPLASYSPECVEGLFSKVRIQDPPKLKYKKSRGKHPGSLRFDHLLAGYGADLPFTTVRW
jgi:hypothetical protein